MAEHQYATTNLSKWGGPALVFLTYDGSVVNVSCQEHYYLKEFHRFTCTWTEDGGKYYMDQAVGVDRAPHEGYNPKWACAGEIWPGVIFSTAERHFEQVWEAKLHLSDAIIDLVKRHGNSVVRGVVDEHQERKARIRAEREENLRDRDRTMAFIRQRDAAEEADRAAAPLVRAMNLPLPHDFDLHTRVMPTKGIV